MTEPKLPSDEFRQGLVDEMVDYLKAEFAQSNSPSELVERVSIDSANTEIAKQPDGVVPVETPKTVMQELNATDDEVFDEYEKDMGKKPNNVVDFTKYTVKKNEEFNKGYYKTEAQKQPVQPKAVDKELEKAEIVNITRGIENYADQIVTEEKKKAAEKPKWTDSEVLYRANSYTDSKGKSVEFKQAVEHVDWGEALNKSNPLEAIETLRVLISKKIYEHFGGWRGIKTIIVRNQQLIINGICYIPAIEKQYLSAKNFPLDSLDYLKNGCIASFFNWRYLHKMRRLVLLDVDDVNFYTTSIADDLACGRRIGVSSIFNVVPSLDIFVLGGETITREELTTPKSVPIKDKVAKSKRSLNFSDGYKINVYGGTNGLQNFFFNSMKNYANNRGNKGFLRYGIGTVVRASAFGAAGVLNLGTHIIGGIFQTFKTAMTDITEEDLK